MKIFYSLTKLLLVLFCATLISSLEPSDVRLTAISPNSGPTYGDTRVMVRFTEFSADWIKKYPHPVCRFGSSDHTVNATIVKCTKEPRPIGARQATTAEKISNCVQCEDTMAHEAGEVRFTVSFTGDFSDEINGVTFTYYEEPVIDWIYPRYGPKDGNTMVEVHGRGFKSFQNNLRCGFGSKEVPAIFISDQFIKCMSPGSSIVQKTLPFSVSLNNQQNTNQNIPFIYYDNPQVFRLEPKNRGPDTGGTVVRIRGQNFNPTYSIPEVSNLNDTFCIFGTLDNARPQLAKVISSTEIECVSPPNFIDKQVQVEITLNNQQWTDDNVMFYYYHPPMIYTIDPKIGPLKGGTKVKVTGKNFEDTGIVKCKFGDILGEGQYVRDNELICISPPAERPVTVPLQVAVSEDEEYSSGQNTMFRYFAMPIVERISPTCGPEEGFTQITVYGINFPVGHTNEVKCLFNRKIKTDATVIDDKTLKCDSPSVLDAKGINTEKITQYTLELIVNDAEIAGKEQIFSYYKAPIISQVAPFLGEVQGGTTINITGANFKQENACNVVVRFATYHAKPEKIEDKYMILKSPEANHTGSVVVQVSLNGQQFEKDIQYNYRDEQNTFYYYKCPVTVQVSPEQGPSSGGNTINLYGINYLEPFMSLTYSGKQALNKIDGKMERKIYYRFVDAEDTSEVYGGTQTAILTEENSQKIPIFVPNILNELGNSKRKTFIQISFNGETYCESRAPYTFYKLPSVTEVTPKFAPLSEKNQEVSLTLDDFRIDTNVETQMEMIRCKFKSTQPNSNKVFIVKGEYVGEDKIKCHTPYTNIPEEFIVEASFNNGHDFTNSGKTFAYYDPFVLSVEPQMISTKGHTPLIVRGYGFADTGDYVKVQYGDTDANNIKCGSSNCVEDGEYINSTTIKTTTIPMADLFDEVKGEAVKPYERIPVEVSVYGNDFTNNKASVFYFEEPKIIQKLDEINPEEYGMYASEVNCLKNAMIGSLPCNVDTYIPIPVDGREITQHLREIEEYTNYTCKFEVSGEEKETIGIFTSFPAKNNIRNLFLCQSPRFPSTVGNAKVRISLNGHDYSEDYYNMLLTEPINIYKVQPNAGPIEGGTKVSIFGTGFSKDTNNVFKWGPQNLVPMSENNFLEYVNNIKQNDEIIYGPANNEGVAQALQSKFDISKINLRAPAAPNMMETKGGLDYISASKVNLLPLDDFLTEYYANNFIHSNFEYYYYKQIFVESFNPKGALIEGGEDITIAGAWFQNKPEYGAVPFCKFGENIVKGEYISTVRIKCKAPANDNGGKVPLCVSLNAADWVCANDHFRYYADLSKLNVAKIEPAMGPAEGGTILKIFGNGLEVILNESDLECMFEPTEGKDKVYKTSPAFYNSAEARKKSIIAAYGDDVNNEKRKKALEAINENESWIECMTPGGWEGGSKTNLKLGFDGGSFIDTTHDFYFYKIDKIVPRAAPNTGLGDISFVGGGFRESDKLEFTIDNLQEKPLKYKTSKLTFDVPEKDEDFEGYVDMGINLGVGENINYKNGFYYYKQPEVYSVYPKSGPYKGRAAFKVKGKGFRDDFQGANVGCKLGTSYGVGKVISDEELFCNFTSLPIEEAKEDEKKIGNQMQIALNNVSFTEGNQNLKVITYSIFDISPVSGPIDKSTDIIVKGSGFYNTDNIRCRFGVKGYYAYTDAKFINYNKIICPSPTDFPIPPGGQLPFTVPFGIAFNEEAYSPWTESTHTFTFYKEPEIFMDIPSNLNTTDITEITLKTDIAEDKENIFMTPTPSVKEETYQVVDEQNEDGNPILREKKTYTYQPIKCKFGDYGTTDGEYLNRTKLVCLTPNFKENREIVYEEVDVEVAQNGVDFIKAGKLVFEGPDKGGASFVYVLVVLLGIIFIAAIIALIAYLFSDKMRGLIINEPHAMPEKNMMYNNKVSNLDTGHMPPPDL